MIATAPAQSLYWDVNGAMAGAGGPAPAGSWDTTTPNWSTSASGNVATTLWTDNASATFSAGTDATGTYALVVGGTRVLGALAFEDGNITLGGGTLSLNPGASVSVTPGRTANIDSILDGASWSFSGGGRLALSGLNAFTGPVSMNAGRLLLDSDSALGTGALLVTPSSAVYLQNSVALSTLPNAITLNLGPGTVDVSALAGTLVLNGPIAGNQTLWTVGGQAANTVVFGGNNSFAGNLQILGGTLALTHNNALGDTGGNTRINAGTTLAFDGGFIYSAAETIKLYGNGVAGQGAIRNLGGDNIFYGQIDLQTDGTIGAAAGKLELAGSISGNSRDLFKVGSGRLVLSGLANDYKQTVVSGGTLEVKTTAGSAAVTVNPGATLAGAGDIAGSVVLAGNLSPATSPGEITTGPQTWAGAASYSWEINDADFGMAGDGIGWDLANIANGLGTLTINATTADKFLINITSLDLSDAPGEAWDFDNTAEYDFEIVRTTAGITGFDPAKFTLDTTGFQNPMGNGAFILEQSANSLFLRFVQKPKIVTSPEPQTIDECRDVTFSVTASGTAPLSYQWYFENNPLPGATTSSYSILGVTPANAGTYSVVVSNLSGSTATAAATLTVVDPPPVIVGLPANITVQTGPGRLTCDAVATWTAPTATDNCSVASFTSTHNPGDTFQVGTTIVTYTAEDSGGHSTAESFSVTVEDTTPPVAACKPFNLVLNALGEGSITVADVYDDANTTDNCSAVEVVSLSKTNFTFCDLGANEVVVTVKDTAGNLGTCTATVTVQPPPDAPAVAYADASYGSTCATVTFPATAGTGAYYVGYNAFASIQDAVDAVATGGTVYVAAGLYEENVTVPKTLSLLGPNAGLAGADLARQAEARIIPAVSDPEELAIISVEADGVTVDGFYLDGHNPVLGASYKANGVDVHAAAGVQNGPFTALVDINQVTIQNNIITNISYDGVYLELSLGFENGGNYIRRNKFANMWEGLQTYAMHSVVADNLFLSCNWGMSLHGTTAPAPVGFTPLVSSNVLTIAEWWPTDLERTNAQGIWINYRRNDAAELDVVGNTINTPVAPPVGSNIRGLYALTVDGNGKVNFIDNTVNGAGNCTYGVYAAGCWSNNAVSVLGGSFNDIAGVGILAQSFDPVWLPAGDTYLLVSNATINMASGIGILASQGSDSPANVAAISIQGATAVNGGTTAVAAKGSLASISFDGPAPAELTGSAQYIELGDNGFTASTTDVDATAVLFDGKTGADMTLAELFATEDKVQHRLDNAALGLVRVKALILFVTPASGSIQRAVDAADPGDSIHVAVGTFVENVVADKPIALLGPNAGISGVNPARVPEAMILPAVDDAESTPIIAVLADDVVVDGFLLDGDNPALTAGYEANAVDVNAAAGVQNGFYPMLEDINRITIQNNIIRNVSYDGVYLELTFGLPNGWNYIRNNLFENMWEGLQTYAMHSVISDNIFLSCNWGMSVHGTVTPAPDGFTPIISSNELTIAEWWPAVLDRSNAQGIWVNYRRGDAAELNVVGNTVYTPTPAPAGKTIRAFYAMTVDGNGKINFVDNEIKGYANCDIGLDAVACWTPGNVNVLGGAFLDIKGTGILAKTTDPVWYNAADTFLTISNTAIMMSPGGTGIAAVQDSSTPFSQVGVTVIGNTSITGAETGVLVQGPLASATLKDNTASITANAVGLLVDAGKALVENNNLTGNSSAAIRVQNSGIVDAGDCTGGNITGLATGSAPNGSSAGLNNLAGYGFDGAAPWAIENLGSLVVAYQNNFGATATDNIASLLSGPVNFSQLGGTLVACPASVAVECVGDIPAGAATLEGFAADGGNVSCFPAAISFVDHPASPTPGDTVVTRTFTIIDACGISSTCTQTITVQDTTLPAIAAPANVIFNADPGACAASALNVTLGTPVTSDNCGVESVTSDAPQQYPIGQTVVTWTVTDINGLTATASQLVTIVDNQPPTITPPPTVVVNTDSNQCFSSTVVLGAPTANDNCTVTNISNDGLGQYPKGNTIVTWTVKDSSGLTTTATQLVVVQDNQMPEMSLPTDITITTSDPVQPYFTGTPKGWDNCGTFTITYGDTPFLTNCNATGVIRRNWRIVDSSARPLILTQNITVVDSAPPLFTSLPAAITAVNDPGQCGANVSFALPTASDFGYRQGFEDEGFESNANGESPDWNDSYSHVSRVLTGTGGILSKTGGAHGQIDSTVSNAVAFFKGAFSNLGGATRSFGKGFRTSLDVYLNLADPAVTANTYGFTLASLVSDKFGNTLRYFSFHAASDSSGQLLVAADTVNSPNKREDLASLNHYVVTSSGWFTFEWVFQDNGSGVLAVNCILRDASGTILLTETLSNPADVIATTVGGNNAVFFTFITPDKLAIDNTYLERFAEVATSVASGSFFPVGATTVTCTAADACGNATNTSFTITVNDTELPLISCPGTITQPSAPNLCGAVVNFTVPATDNCGVSTVSVNPAAGSFFQVGTTPVNVSVTDIHGNTAYCTFNVVVNDTQAPVVACPSPVVRFVSKTANFAIVNFPAPVVSDNCGFFNVATSPGSGSAFPVGTNTVTAMAWDSNGNTNTCTFTVAVVRIDPMPTLRIADYTNSTAVVEVSGFEDLNVVLQASPDLTTWQNVHTNNMPFIYIDPASPASDARFYRAVYMP